MAIDLEPLWDTGKPEVSEQRLRQALAGAAGDEARARYELELRRTFASATHPPQLQTPENRERARSSFEAALNIARAGHLDGLAIDAIHMLAFVATAPADQLKWAQAASASSRCPLS